MQTEWEKAQEWELKWHDNCINSLNEELKQLVYAQKIGLIRKPSIKTPYIFDLEGASVLDIGGGAYSLLLKCVNFVSSWVVDPLMHDYPNWVIDRYDTLGVSTSNYRGEDLDEWTKFGKEVFDECWIYNVLEHCEDPKKVVKNALKLGKIVRVFEWLDVRTNTGHLHTLTQQNLDTWFGGEGKVEILKEGGAVGKAYYGIFRGEQYDLS